MTATAQPVAVQPAAAARPAATAGSRWLLAILLTGQFMAMLDVAIVNVGAPTIRTELNASGAGLQLIVAGYTITYAVLLITGARVGARRGHRSTFLVGLGGFTLASLACGLAATSGQLVAFRFLQGAGAAFMMPQVFSLIQRTFEGPARARALSYYAAVIAGGAVIGQIAGGVLVSADLFGTSWRPVFLVNVPIGLILLIAGLRLLPVDPGDATRSLDLPGLAVVTPTVLLFIVPLVLGHEQGWPAWGWISLGASALGFVAFLLVERQVERRGGAPLVPGRVVRVRTVAISAAVLVGSFTVFGGWQFVLAVYVQNGLGRSPLVAGLMFFPGALGFATASLTWRRLPEGWHRGLIPVGLAVATVAMVLLAVVVGTAGPGGPTTAALVAVFCLNGLGMGYAFSPVISVALSEVPPADAANASGLLTTVLQLSQAIGVATFGTLYLSLVATRLPSPSMTLTSVALAIVEITAVAFAILLLRRTNQVLAGIPGV